MKNQLIFALDVTGPLLILLSLGYFFRRINLIDDPFISVGNKVVFNVTLPCLLFFGIVNQPLSQSLDLPLVLFAVISTLITVCLLWMIAPCLVKQEKRGVFIQGAFRGNMGVIGIALVLNAYGPEILPKTSIYLALLTILYNILSVLVLGHKEQSFLRTLIKNPLVIAVLLGLSCSWAGVPIPEIIHKSGRYFAQMTLPLALLCIGGSLRWSSFQTHHRDVMWASAFKLLFIPVTVTFAAIICGFMAQDLGLLYLMMSTPTAAASYVMARQMTSHGTMAAEIVAMSTVGCAVTITGGLILLNSGGYI